MAQAAVADIPRLIAELRDHIARKTGKPIDPDVDFLTTQIEMLSMATPLANSWIGLELTLKERRLLDCLASRPGMVFSKDALMNALYFDCPRDSPEPKIIDIFVCKLRGKLHETDFRIRTHWGVGFSLVDANAAPEPRTAQKGTKPTGRKCRQGPWREFMLTQSEKRLAEILESYTPVPREILVARMGCSLKAIMKHISRLRAKFGRAYGIAFVPASKAYVMVPH